MAFKEDNKDKDEIALMDGKVVFHFVKKEVLWDFIN